MRSLLTFALALVLSVPNIATAKRAHSHKNTKGAKTSLYQRLGGKKAIEAVVDDFVTRCATDERIKSFFAATAKNPQRLNHFKSNLVAQICQAAGGPCKYKGKDMRTAHAGMGIQESHFNALVEDLQATMSKFGVKQKEQGQLLAVLGPMKSQIVTAPTRNTASVGGTDLQPAPLQKETPPQKR